MPTVLGLTNDSKSKSPKPAMNNISKPGTAKTDKNGERLNTISKRNHAAAKEVETLLWRALCDDPEQTKEYLAEDCIMINPLFNDGSSEPMGRETEPSIEEALENAEPWAAFKFHSDPFVVEIDLMAVATDGGMREIVVTVSSAWKQTAGADWLLCAQHVAYADDD
ncbi:hypothetical protein B0T17DRAFT_480761 [Bombardia bombarda]|uniref:DUF4440 domain-containing protein n=1 Tax=Bombardia bombarda TaxID=252184 RepID=A0AA40CEL3_9PEZI|nr:hypothetical protein B0T17DRAFT_480761 [Bombardia bombarda]